LKQIKTEPLEMSSKIEISLSLYKKLNEELDIKKSFSKIEPNDSNDFNFLLNHNVSYRRFFPRSGFNFIKPATFKVKLGKKHKKLFYDNRALVPKYSNEHFFFCFKFQKRFSLDRSI
jgi:hypothetical protein